jgi:hypothetical protein
VPHREGEATGRHQSAHRSAHQMGQGQRHDTRAQVDEEGRRGDDLVDQLRREQCTGRRYDQQRTAAASATGVTQLVHAQCRKERSIDARKPAVDVDLRLAGEHHHRDREGRAEQAAPEERPARLPALASEGGEGHAVPCQMGEVPVREVAAEQTPELAGQRARSVQLEPGGGSRQCVRESGEPGQHEGRGAQKTPRPGGGAGGLTPPCRGGCR